MPFPRTTHQWLQPLYRALNSPTGIPSFYGASGAARIGSLGFGLGMSGGTLAWSGSSGILGTGIGGSGLLSAVSQFGWNGGTGSVVSINEIVKALKNIGIVPA